MPEKVEVTGETMDKIKRAASDFKDSVGGFFKDYSVEMKDWHFNVQSSEKGAIADVSFKVLISPKSKKHTKT